MTSPVHVPRWGTFVKADVGGSAAGLALRTDVRNHDKSAKTVRVVSTVVGPSGETVGRATSTPASIGNGDEHTYEQKMDVKQPKMWSLEERNLYKLVTELQCDGSTVDRYETRFGIRTVAFDAENDARCGCSPRPSESGLNRDRPIDAEHTRDAQCRRQPFPAGSRR